MADKPVEHMAIHTEAIEDHYDIGAKLGSGHFSVVKEGTLKKTGEKFAVKIIDKRKLGNQKDRLMKEVEILEALDHTNIIKLLDIYETPRRLYLVMELVTGGELFDRIVEKGSYSERDAAFVIMKITSAVKYLHDRGIVHRDLKPENLLYATESLESEIKLADFGLSTLVSEEDMLRTACGTPGYVAPEVLKNKGYTKAVDMWSIGVIMYILLCGFPPFYEENTAQLFEQIMAGRYDFPDPYWTNISPSAKELIQKLLVVDADGRYTADQVLAHPWITGQACSDGDLMDVMKTMKKFNARRKFKMGILASISVNRMQRLAGAHASSSGSK